MSQKHPLQAQSIAITIEAKEDLIIESKVFLVFTLLTYSIKLMNNESLTSKLFSRVVLAW